MKDFSRLATAAAAIPFVSLLATVVLAQNALTKGTETTTTPAANAATAAAPADAKPATATEQAKKTKPGPARYRKSSPKEYLHFVPFDKMW